MNKKILVITIVLCILLTTSAVLSARREEEPEQQVGIAGQFLGSFTCMMTECGWPAIVLFILPAIAIYIWKKIFSWG